jgi:hypothetical protein
MFNLRLSIASIAICLATFTVNAQHSVNTTGGDATGSGGSFSYSVGQIVYSSQETSSARIIEGVQQPYEIFVVTGSNNWLSNKLNIRLYPNPTMDVVTLSLSEYRESGLSFQVHDLQGRKLISGEIAGVQTQVNLFNLPAATYLLTVSNRKREIRTFKIIKVS